MVTGGGCFCSRIPLLRALHLSFPLSLGFRFCNACDFYDGFTCLKPQKSCSKFNLFFPTACTTDHFYFYHRRTGTYLYRYSKLSCRPCEAGMSQLFHDLLRETHCCLKDKCNDVEKTLDIFKSPR
uniref:Prostate and testis expressed 2 n=1 Tax=Sus scrofa TaxID=9823 RepID=A0A8D1ILR6_PIG